MVITCSRCANTWTGLGRAHCGACHQTFNRVSLFDRHRRGGSCLSAENLGLVQVSGVWRDQSGAFDASDFWSDRSDVEL